MRTPPFIYTEAHTNAIRDSIDLEHSLKESKWAGQRECLTEIVRQGLAKQLTEEDEAEALNRVNPRHSKSETPATRLIR